MAERAKVIVHMYTTIDGKTTEYLNGSRDARFGGTVYDQFVLTLGEAWGCGRATFDNKKGFDLGLYGDKPHELVDHWVESENTPYCIAIDRFGKLRLGTDRMRYGPSDCQIIEALTENIDPRVLHYLDDTGIGYIFCGKDKFDMHLFLEKLYEKGIKTFVLCGGAEINQEFLKEDLVDEISLIIVPGVSGTRNGITSFGAEVPGSPKLFQLKSVKDLGHNCVRLVYTKPVEENK